jgi:hypothetical protein
MVTGACSDGLVRELSDLIARRATKVSVENVCSQAA